MGSYGSSVCQRLVQGKLQSFYKLWEKFTDFYESQQDVKDG